MRTWSPEAHDGIDPFNEGSGPALVIMHNLDCRKALGLAGGGAGGPDPGRRDHIMMCKFETKSDATFERVYKRIQRMRRVAGSAATE